MHEDSNNIKVHAFKSRSNLTILLRHQNLLWQRKIKSKLWIRIPKKIKLNWYKLIFKALLIYSIYSWNLFQVCKLILYYFNDNHWWASLYELVYPCFLSFFLSLSFSLLVWPLHLEVCIISLSYYNGSFFSGKKKTVSKDR